MADYITIESECAFDFTEKKSKFRGALYPVSSAEEVSAKMAELRKKYWDATHNCMAVILGEKREYMRFSDDGEPQGTAGMPMLEALKGSGATNILAVATRYFGGVLLGAGGLVRAYTRCVTGALECAKMVQMVQCETYLLTLPYSGYGKLENIIMSRELVKGAIIFEENVRARVAVPTEMRGAFENDVKEAFLGSVVPEAAGAQYVKKPL